MSLSVGCRALSAFDSIQNARVASWLLYPSEAPAQSVRFGNYGLELAIDAQVAPGVASLPLVALSHGNGSTPWVHRGLATHLVQAGFAVLMIEHPGNNRNDNSLGFTGAQRRVKLALLEHRPRHVRLAVDSALADELVGPKLARTYAVIGESIGGYTALAVAGGRALTLPDEVDDAQLSLPPSELGKLAVWVKTQPDERVRAVVLFSPALFFFMYGSLADVHVPVLLRVGTLDSMCPPAIVMQCLRSLPNQAQLEGSEVAGAGHFSYQTPYPPELAQIPSAQDPAGFDRAAYQATLKQDVGVFLRSALG
jgi:predicted dienelactone hydrolase